MNNTVTITGASGGIGRLLTTHLNGFELVPMDLPDRDVLDPDVVSTTVRGSDAIVHLAWNSRRERGDTEEIDSDNIRMANNVYRGAVVQSIPRVVVASSVHVDALSWKPGFRRDQSIQSQANDPVPSSPYGASKLMIEALGRYYVSRYSLEVICIRLGGVWIDGRRFGEVQDEKQRAAYLSHKDLIGVFRHCLRCTMAEPYHHFFAVSDHEARIHDTTNNVGWVSTYSSDE